jgi:peptidoglycan/xylan/chitin deacetylase (PgdA/CDA1 family)
MSAAATQAPILLYHRFGPTPADSMTVTDTVFLSHLDYLAANGYTVVPLRRIVESLQRKEPMPVGSVAIVVDDGHRSVYTNMLPVVMKYRIPVTLFIYPSAISNASYAMSWSQLHELQKTGLFDIQSHTFWHPNFKKEKKRLGAKEYEQFVRTQFVKSKARLEKEFGTRIDMLAWPFGIYDDDLMAKAKEAGYIAAFTIEGARETRLDNPMKLPRYLLTNADRGKRFEMILANSSRQAAAGGFKK